MPHPSISKLWDRYRLIEPQACSEPPIAEYFSDNEEDANMCVDLVVKGLKRATASALLAYQEMGKAPPEPSKLLIVTNWAGEAKALIRTHTVTIHRLAEVTTDFAKLEGEGDGTLEWWRDAHRRFWERTLVRHTVDDNLLVVCEEFQVLLTA